MNRAMRRASGRGIENGVRRSAGMHPLIAAGIKRAAKERKAKEVAKPLSVLLDMLANGEVFDIEGVPMVAVPEDGKPLFGNTTELLNAEQYIRGWMNLLARLLPGHRLDKMGYLAQRLADGKELTPRLVDLAREEFDAAIGRLPGLDDGLIERACLDQQIVYAMERAA